jgi:hypothetical protein
VPVDDQMMLAAWAGPVHRGRPGVEPPLRARARLGPHDRECNA